MSEQTTPCMTGKQKRDIRELLRDALDEFSPTKDQAQKVLGNGGKLKADVKKLLAKYSASGLLDPVGTVTIPAIATFRTKEHFKDDRSGPVVIGWIGDNFRRVFLSGDGMIEGAVTETTLQIHQLTKNSVDTPIITELDESVAETTLGQMYEMMKVQGHGEQGNLLTNGYANIFYVRDRDNVLWAVGCGWNAGDGGWGVYAGPVAAPGRWGAGRQVVSH